MKLKIRNDDVLQTKSASKSQRKALIEKSFFEWFLEADKIFEEYNYPCTLVVLAEGIDKEKEWVEYIKKNIHRYKIELHGYSHSKYVRMNKEQGKKDLAKAIKKIEDTFKCKITTWYVPFGRKNVPNWGEQVCKELGIKIDIPIEKTLPYFYRKGIRNINFHFWDLKQINQIDNIIKSL